MNVPPSRSSGESLPCARPLDDRLALCGQLDERLALGLAQHRDEEPALGRHGEPDVRVREDPELVVRVVSVQPAVPQQGDRTELRQNVGHRHALVAEPLSQLLRSGHVGGHGDLEGGRLPGLGQPARDRLAERRELLDLRLERRRADGGVRGRGRGALDVLGDDTTLGARAGERAELDAALARDATRERRRLQAAPVRGCLLLGSRVGGGFAATLALLLARGPGRTLFLRLIFGDLGRLLLRLDLLPGLADDGNPSCRPRSPRPRPRGS